MDHGRLNVSTPQGPSGTLFKEGESYLFGYTNREPAAAISLTMPVRAAQYCRPALHPVFQMNLPEGFMLEELRNRLAKVMPLDPMLLLALSGGDTAIGRVRVDGSALHLPGHRELPTRRPALAQVCEGHQLQVFGNHENPALE
jgi:serine/threonine-protein kinase HipA